MVSEEAAVQPAHLGRGDALPPGPFAVGLTWDFGLKRLTPPWTVSSVATGQAICGDVPSQEIAQAIAAALNREAP